VAFPWSESVRPLSPPSTVWFENLILPIPKAYSSDTRLSCDIDAKASSAQLGMSRPSAPEHKIEYRQSGDRSGSSSSNWLSNILCNFKISRAALNVAPHARG